MKIKIYSMGCAKCDRLYQIVQEVVSELGCACQIEKISDIKEMMKNDVLSTPALVIDDKLVCSGRVPDKEEIKKFLNK